ncbi:hypothetical protein Nit79A3_2391 [Nitrosomonas sp. Is79A3]|uniref:hypothetical protein n=1 Tax=Nitrosomonas sp. (strain Is79A3) TaxID=261292 RepID=UPI000215CA18
MPLSLIKYLPDIICGLLVIGACWFVVHEIHQNGRTVERAEWLEKEKAQTDAIAKAMGEAMQRVAEQNEKNQKNTMEVLNAKDQAINNLENDMRAQRATNRGLWITAEACDDNGAMPGKTKNTSQPGDPEQIRLPGDVERRLRDLAETAQRLAIDHNACVAELAPLVDVIADH